MRLNKREWFCVKWLDKFVFIFHSKITTEEWSSFVSVFPNVVNVSASSCITSSTRKLEVSKYNVYYHHRTEQILQQWRHYLNCIYITDLADILFIFSNEPHMYWSFWQQTPIPSLASLFDTWELVVQGHSSTCIAFPLSWEESKREHVTVFYSRSRNLWFDSKESWEMTAVVVKGSEDTHFCGILFSVTTEARDSKMQCCFEPTVMPQSDTTI